MNKVIKIKNVRKLKDYNVQVFKIDKQNQKNYYTLLA